MLTVSFNRKTLEVGLPTNVNNTLPRCRGTTLLQLPSILDHSDHTQQPLSENCLCLVSKTFLILSHTALLIEVS